MSSSERPCILIAAASGRALAAAARRAGYRALVADFFDDLDTRALAEATLVAADMERGFEAAALMPGLARLAHTRDPIGIVCGSGFEDRTELLATIARRYPLCGNSAAVVGRAKDPQVLDFLCNEFSIPHPEIRSTLPRDSSDWLIKRQGGGGGIHVGPARDRPAKAGEYYQRRVRGRPASVLLLADGTHAEALGTSSQWQAPDAAMPYRFGGAVRPAAIDVVLAQKLCHAATTIATALHLVGLNSVDFLVDGSAFHLLEINPRPGATLDIFADRDGTLFAAHVEACRGHLPDRPLVFTTASATAIAYAPCAFACMPALEWPPWCLDRQKPGTTVRLGDPVCTLSAEADDTEAARALVETRGAEFRNYLMLIAHKENAA